MKKKVYVTLAVDYLHEGHLNILKIAKKYGDVTVGLLTDNAIAHYKRIPDLNYEQREKIVKNLNFVKNVVSQDTEDYTDNLKKIKPDFLVHGDDWINDNRKVIRQRAIKTLKKWGGRLIEPKYSRNIIAEKNDKKNNQNKIENRVNKLSRLIQAKDIVRVLESHNSLTGLIIENLSLVKKNKFFEFDCMWSSSLTDSAVKGKPDNQAVDYSSRILSLNDTMDVTSKPVIFDADNGGRIEHLGYLIRSLERSGVSAIAIEDKIGLKKNSLFKNQKGTKQDNPLQFAKKIKKIVELRNSKDFMIIARIESFILNKGLEDAIKRAEIYSKAGADAILIHSKNKTPKEIFSFAKKFNLSKYKIPLVAVPSTYSTVKEKDLIKYGFKIVIYANQLLRAAFPAMENVAKNILINSRCFEIENKIIPIKKIINLIK